MIKIEIVVVNVVIIIINIKELPIKTVVNCLCMTSQKMFIVTFINCKFNARQFPDCPEDLNPDVRNERVLEPGRTVHFPL